MNKAPMVQATDIDYEQAFLSDLRQLAVPIEAELQLFFAEQLHRIPANLLHAQNMLQVLHDFCLTGGKRLRPYLVVCGCQLVSDHSEVEVMPLAIVTELMHAFLLIHDDIMDQSPLRRGKPTVHTRYTQELLQAGYNHSHAQRYGESLGILAGDLCYTLMLRLISQLTVPENIRAHLLEIVSDAIANTMYGQELDLRFECQTTVSSAAVLDMYRLKTAGYSFEAPLQLGARLGQAPDQVLKLLHDYAIPCGIAFQIQDDILGLFGEEEKTGKSVTTDLQQGKRTLLLVKALELSTKSDHVLLTHIISNHTSDLEVVEEIRRVVRDSGALAACEQLAQENIEQATQALHQLSDLETNRAVQAKLEGLTQFIINRES